MKKYFHQWIESSLKVKLEIIALIMGIILTPSGAYITYTEYKTQHELEINSQLKETDRNINSMILNYPAMDALWITGDDKLHGKARADAILIASMNTKSKDIKKALTDWKEVGDLESIMWSEENLHNAEFIKFRQVYMLAEVILYLVVEVLDLEEQHRITPTDARTYTAYIRDLGSHPLFLHAIWFGHKSGYFTPKVALRLQSELKKNKEAVEMANAIYKELLSPDWASKIPE
jgi:hypothetical protein